MADNIEVRCPLTLYLKIQNMADRVILYSAIWFRNMFCNRQDKSGTLRSLVSLTVNVLIRKQLIKD
jgi:hypothetical protein